MPRLTIWTLALSLAITSAALAATAEEKCQKKKKLALGKRALCIETEEGKAIVGKTPNLAGCEEKFQKQLTAAEKKVACRWLDHGDGTATDLNTGLQWELKTDDDSIHDKDNKYSWSATPGKPDGGVFVDFLAALNGGESSIGTTTTGCFADKCGWRLPSVEELAGILDRTLPLCRGIDPCTTIPGETPLAVYWSSSTDARPGFNNAWYVSFFPPFVSLGGKSNTIRVRAVRGGR